MNTYVLHLRTKKSPTAKRWEVKSVSEGRARAAKRFCPKDGSYWIGEYKDGLLVATYDA